MVVVVHILWRHAVLWQLFPSYATAYNPKEAKGSYSRVITKTKSIYKRSKGKDSKKGIAKSQRMKSKTMCPHIRARIRVREIDRERERIKKPRRYTQQSYCYLLE